MECEVDKGSLFWVLKGGIVMAANLFSIWGLKNTEESNWFQFCWSVLKGHVTRHYKPQDLKMRGNSSQHASKTETVPRRIHKHQGVSIFLEGVSLSTQFPFLVLGPLGTSPLRAELHIGARLRGGVYFEMDIFKPEFSNNIWVTECESRGSRKLQW